MAKTKGCTYKVGAFMNIQSLYLFDYEKKNFSSMTFLLYVRSVQYKARGSTVCLMLHPLINY